MNILKYIVICLVLITFSYSTGYSATVATSATVTKTVSASVCTPKLKVGTETTIETSNKQKSTVTVASILSPDTIVVKTKDGKKFKAKIGSCQATSTDGPQGIILGAIIVVVIILIEIFE